MTIEINNSAEATPARAARLRDVVAGEVRIGDLLRALIAIAPLVAAYFFYNQPAFLDLSLVSVSLLLSAQNVQLPNRLIALQFIAILFAFVVLLLAAPIKLLFILLAGAGAFLAIALTRYGTALRTVGTWTYLPALYLAYKVHEDWISGVGLRDASIIVAFAPLALALVYAVHIFDRRKLLTEAGQPYGEAARDWLLSGSAAGISVVAAATAVEMFNLPQGQWMIWSAASVVVGDLATSAHKLKLRAWGALVGVPLGLLAGHWLPTSRAGYSFAVLGATLTIVAFNRYVLGFGARCFFIALAAAFAGGASGIAEARIFNVLLGGVFGIIAVMLSEFAGKRIAFHGRV